MIGARGPGPPRSFAEETRVELSPGGPRRYRARLSDGWNAPVFPSGGVVSAIALRAMEQELGQAHQRLRSFSTVFVSTVGSGSLEISVEPLRIGRRMSQLHADVRDAGKTEPGHVTTAAFGEARPGFEFSYVRAPEVGPPQEYPGPATPPPGTAVFRPPFFENIEVRRVRMFQPFETGWEPGRAEAVRWIRYRTPPRLSDGRIDPLSLVALADTMPAAVAQFLGPGYPFFHAPSVDLSMRFFADTEEDWFLVRSLGHWAGDGYASAEVTLWDRCARLVAHATQLMLIRFPDPADLITP